VLSLCSWAGCWTLSLVESLSLALARRGFSLSRSLAIAKGKKISEWAISQTRRENSIYAIHHSTVLAAR
jgi:hypothetical protein